MRRIHHQCYQLAACERADGIGTSECRRARCLRGRLTDTPHGGVLHILIMHSNCHSYYPGAARSHKFAVVDNGQGVTGGGGGGAGGGGGDPRQVAVELLQVRPEAAATAAGECVDRSSTRAEVGSRGVAELTGGYGDSAEEAASLFMATSGGGGGRSLWQAAHPAPVSIPTSGGHHQLHAAAGGSCSRGGGSATAVKALHGILGGGDHHQPSINVAAGGDRFVGQHHTYYVYIVE